MKQASFWEPKKGRVQCHLCPRRCIISLGKVGVCGARRNIKGKLYAIYYARPASVAVDPIEKKPLYHFLPGSKSLSVGTPGCNLKCLHCQNWQISQESIPRLHLPEAKPEKIISEAIKNKCRSVSFTYTEPTIFYEYMYDTAKLAKKRGLKTTIVSNGYINKEPLEKLVKYIDGANIDLKGFTEKFYQKVCKASLKPVLETLKTLKKKGVWIEITNLIIPGLNDKPSEIKKMCKWIVENLGKNVPLHFSAFYPTHKMNERRRTTIKDLRTAYEIAREQGIKFVYLGNVYAGDAENTYCPSCNELLLNREVFSVLKNKTREGKCKCKEKIPGVWE